MRSWKKTGNLSLGLSYRHRKGIRFFEINIAFEIKIVLEINIVFEINIVSEALIWIYLDRFWIRSFQQDIKEGICSS